MAIVMSIKKLESSGYSNIFSESLKHKLLFLF